MFLLIISILFIPLFDCNQFYTTECSKDWFNFENKKCVYILKESVINYTESVSKCLELNASLVTIGSEDENLFLTSLLYELNPKVKGLYIGLKRKVKNDSYLNEFEWTDGSDLVYENWAQGEPSPWFEPCVEIFSVDINAGKWNDMSCGGHRFAICQQWISHNAINEYRSKFELCEHLDYIRYRSNCYKIYNYYSSLDWKTADLKCRNDHKNGSLVYIEDSYEYSFLKYWTLSDLRTYEFWIGLIAKNNSLRVQYEWSNDFPVYFTAWESTQPRFRSGFQTQCTVQDRDTGLWRLDPYCADRRAFVCKISGHMISGDQTYVNALCPTLTNSTTDQMNDQWINLHRNLKHCHWFSGSLTMTWIDASKHCHKRNGSLISIHSRHESQLLKPFIQKYGRPLWIGLYQSPGGFYRWEDGSDLDFKNWFPGEPSDENQEPCVEMRAQDMTWNDIHCTQRKLQFICEINKILVINTIIENKSLISNKSVIKDIVSIRTQDTTDESELKRWMTAIAWTVLAVIVLTIILLITFYFYSQKVSNFFDNNFRNISVFRRNRSEERSSNVRDSQRSSVNVLDINVY